MNNLPSEVLEDRFNTIIELIESGLPLNKALKQTNTSSASFSEWCKLDDLKAKRYACAREVRAEKIFEEILDIADDSSQDVERVDEYGNRIMNSEFVQRSRVRIDARKWMLAKMHPRVYGDSVKLTGDSDNPIQSKLTIEILPSSSRIASSESEVED